MIKVKPSFKLRIKYFFTKDTLFSIKFLSKALSRIEKIILVALAIVVLVGIFFIWQNQWLKSTHSVPAFGGTFVEGVVGEPKDLDKHINRLTNAGLTRLKDNGDVEGDLASSWEILDDGKTYQFKLRDGFFSQDLAAQIKNKNYWPNITVETPAENLISFKFNQPFSPFLYTSTEPIFSYGPYKLVKEEKNHITFEARGDYWQGKPHIQNIVINLYPSFEDLKKDANKGKISGFLKDDNIDFSIPNSNVFEFALPREIDLFFNLSKDSLKNIEIRKRLRDNQALDQPLNLTLVTSENLNNTQIAEKVKESWKKLNVNLEIKKYDYITLQKDIIPKRDYDVLLYGLDYGPDPDPYPFWHTFEKPEDGMNLSNYSNKKADRLLEDARQSFDFKVREQKYTQFKDILNSEVPYIVVEKTNCQYIVLNNVYGISKIFGSSEADRFLNVDQWFMKIKRIRN